MSPYVIPDGAEIDTKENLRDWIRNRAHQYENFLTDADYDDTVFNPSEIAGVQYVSKTLTYDPDEGFIQKGNGPNYFGGVYSLATCRHDIRGTSERPQGWDFDDYFSSVSGTTDLWIPKHPVLIINSTKTTSNGFRRGRWISSIAFVTHAFRTVEGYANHLLEEYTGEVVSNRLTRADDAPIDAIKHGDCHANRDAIVGGPPEGHPHHKGAQNTCGCNTVEDNLHSDNDDDHLKVLSMEDYWIGFDNPTFENTVGGRGHTKIESWDLDCLSEVH